MVRITEELIRKRSEHNECLIGTLEEISLHQEDIEKIEHIQHWAKGLKILLLQNNLISKIENLHKLKSLEYLNLAINNIEEIENLEALESLQKLDLTLNFIGILTSVSTLKDNYNLEILYLTGNPCTDYENYRDFVIATLPQLKCLDGAEITHSDRIAAMQKLPSIAPVITQQQIEYFRERRKQKIRVADKIKDNWDEGGDTLTEEEKIKRFWKTNSEHSPEMRLEMAKISRKSRGKDKEEEEKEETTPKLKLFANDGRPFCLNQPKIQFKFEDKGDHWVLDLAVYKFLDTSMCDVDVQPRYVRVTIKKKIFQMALQDDVNISKSVAQRSQLTGHLVITLPKLNPPVSYKYCKNTDKEENKITQGSLHQGMSRREYLEIGSGPDEMDFSKIIENSKKQKPKKNDQKVMFNGDENEVPPLE